jgi:sigma-B regulation protein RsbU (phosphoserine phosphatase)
MGRVTAGLGVVRRLLRPRRSYRELEGLHEVSQAFSHMTDIRETYGRLTRRLAELVGCEKCVISLYEPETREFVCQWPGYNVADELLKKVRYPADALRPAWNFRHKGPMVNKRPDEFNEEQRAFLRPFGVYNLTEIPLFHEGRFVGKISIANKPGGLSENDVRLVTVFAAQVAVVIQNAHLYRRLQESAAQLEAKVHERTAELEATYRALETSHARLREVDQLKSDFLGNVSHELRTPLAAVKGYVDNLLDGVAGPLADKPRHYLRRVRDNADRLGRMVSDLLDLTRIEAGKIELIPLALPVADLVGDALDGLRHVAAERRVSLESDVPACPPIWADPDKTHQVLTNLLANAIKFSPPGGRVAVVARPEVGGLVRLAVEDTGPGLPAAERERVFDKFYQVGRVEGERPPGTGLGLTIARHLVELHGGRIWAEDASGGGAAFVLLLPSAGAPA